MECISFRKSFKAVIMKPVTSRGAPKSCTLTSVSNRAGPSCGKYGLRGTRWAGSIHRGRCHFIEYCCIETILPLMVSKSRPEGRVRRLRAKSGSWTEYLGVISTKEPGRMCSRALIAPASPSSSSHI